MDQDLQQRIEEARAAGYSDEEIAKVLGTAPPQTTATMPNGPQVPILSAEEKAKFNQEQQATEDANTRENWETAGVAGAMGAAAVGVPILAYKAGKAIFSPATKGVSDIAQRGVGAMERMAETGAVREGRLQNRPGFGGTGGQAVRPVAPQPMPGVATTGPVAPPNMPATNQPMRPPPSMASRIQAAAAQRISNLPAIGEMAGAAGRVAGRVLGPASLLFESRELGPKTPQTGRMRGMEINPLTGAPWTPEQIRQYEANPGVYDAQMAPPQFRR